MRIKSSVLLGLILVICAISGFSLLKRLTQEVDEWRPSNLYSSTNVSRRSTFSVVSSAPASYSEAVASVSSGSGSMFRHRAVSSYAPASGFAYSQSPMAGTASYSQSPIAYSQRLHTTSSAELRSFGGGGNGGSVSMSGGSVKSSGSSVSTPSGLSISMPSTSVYAYNTNRNSFVVSNVVPSFSGDIAMASTQAYAGIGNTTGGASRRISGRKNGSVEDSWLQWLARYGRGFGTESGDEENGYTYSFDYYQLHDAYDKYVNEYWDDMWGDPPTFDQWLLWFQGNGGSHGYRGDMYNWVPVGDYYPLLILAMLYVGYVAIRRRKSKISENNI
jgi:hypothetical protein